MPNFFVNITANSGSRTKLVRN